LQQSAPQQNWVPPAHVAVHATISHTPSVQLVPLLHGWAQLPQFFGSVSTLTHSVLQHFSFAPHDPQVLPPELPPEPPLLEPAPEPLPAPLLDPPPLLLPLFPPELLAEPLLEPVMMPLLDPAPLPLPELLPVLPELPPLPPELPPLLPPDPELLESVDASVGPAVPNDPPQYEESRAVASRPMNVVT
jgi:hypothetical protein